MSDATTTEEAPEAEAADEAPEPAIIANEQMDPPPAGEPVGDPPVITGFSDRQQPDFGVQAGIPKTADDPESPRGKKLLGNFLKLTGYTSKDVIAQNETARIYVTSNGGKYQLSAKGTQVKVLSGPLPPKATEEE
jgi:hypothetical protein